MKKILIYANAVTLEPSKGIDQVISQFANWIGLKTQSTMDTSKWLEKGFTYDFPDKSVLTTQAVPYSTGDGFHALYTHGDERHGQRTWITEVIIKPGAQSYLVDCEIYLHVEQPQDEERLPQQTRPRLVVDLIESCRPVESTPGLYIRELSVQSAPIFVDAVENPRRQIPIIVFCEGGPCKIPVVLDRLRAQVFGLADVYRISNSSSASNVQDVIGNDYSVFGGAIRVIWPMIPGRDSAASLLIIPRSKTEREPKKGFDMERSAFLAVLRRHIMSLQPAYSAPSEGPVPEQEAEKDVVLAQAQPHDKVHQPVELWDIPADKAEPEKAEEPEGAIAKIVHRFRGLRNRP